MCILYCIVYLIYGVYVCIEKAVQNGIQACLTSVKFVQP